MKTKERLIDELIDLAFAEDIGDGDHTTLCCIPDTAMGKSRLLINNQKAKQDDRVTKTIQEYQEKKAYYENHPLVVNYLYLQNEVNEILQTINQQMNNALK